MGTLHTKVKMFLSIISGNLLNHQGISHLVIVLFIVKTYKLNRESNDATRNYMLVNVRAKWCTDLEIIRAFWNVHRSSVPLVSLVTKGAKQLFVTWIPAVVDLKVSDVWAPHVVPEIELTGLTSLSVEWADQMCIGIKACAIGYLSIRIISWNRCRQTLLRGRYRWIFWENGVN